MRFDKIRKGITSAIIIRLIIALSVIAPLLYYVIWKLRSIGFLGAIGVG